MTSVRSPVTNLAAHVPGLTTDAFADALTAEFFAHHAGLRPRVRAHVLTHPARLRLPASPRLQIRVAARCTRSGRT